MIRWDYQCILLPCFILFAKLYTTKASLAGRDPRAVVSQDGWNSVLQIPRPYGHRRRKNFFSGQILTDIGKLKDLIRKTPLEKKKRRKRQRSYSRKHYRLSGIAPTNKRIVMMQSRTGYFLEIRPDGKVRGNINRTKFTRMELQVIAPCLKRIKGLSSGKYLGINRRGKVVSKDNPDAETYFLDTISENFDHLLRSVRYPTQSYTSLPWFLALRKKHGRRGVYGKTKRASRTFRGELATRFAILDDE